MKKDQNTTQTSTALLRTANGVDTRKTNSLCCAAAGIMAPLNATAEALIPHEKLREASTPDATLIAQNRTPAQPVVGYKLPRSAGFNPKKRCLIHLRSRIEDLRQGDEEMRKAYCRMVSRQIEAGFIAGWIDAEKAQPIEDELDSVNETNRSRSTNPNNQAHTGEIERLEAAYAQFSLDAGAEMDRLSAQIAERDALLGRIRVHTPNGAPGPAVYHILDEIDALYAHFEPRQQERPICGGNPLLLCRDCVSAQEAQA